MATLGYCPKCKENSTTTKCYRPKKDQSLLRRVCFCINKGCGYKVELPSLVYSAVKREFVLAMVHSQI